MSATRKGAVAPCGTDSGYQKHKRRGETACDPCKAARAAYMTAWRQISENRARHRAGIKAEDRAKNELARRYPDEYRTLYARFLDESGIYQASA